MTLTLITPPAYMAVSLEEAKQHLEVDYDERDDLITTFIVAATEHAQSFLGRSLVEQVWEYSADAFPGSSLNYEIRLPMPPLLEIVSVKYDDGAGDEQTISDTDYVIEIRTNDYARVRPVASSWPSTIDRMGAVRVRYRAGYASADSPPVSAVPADIKAAILLMVGTLYEQRETVVVGQAANMVPWSAEQLLRRKRVDLSLA